MTIPNVIASPCVKTVKPNGFREMNKNKTQLRYRVADGLKITKLRNLNDCYR